MFERIPLRAKLLILALIPFAAYIIVGGLYTVENYRMLRIIKKQEIYLDYTAKGLHLIHTLQKERGLSATYLGGGIPMAPLNGARQETDSALADYHSIEELTYLSEESLGYIKDLEDQVATFRQKVDSGAFIVPDAMDKYTVLINQIIFINSEFANKKTTGGIGKRLVSMLILTAAQENAGRYRGYTSAVLAMDQPIEDHLLFIIIQDYEGMSINLGSYGLVLEEESRLAIEYLLKSSNWNYVQNTMEAVLSSAETGNFDISPGEFWESASKIVDRINEIIQWELEATRGINKDISNSIRRGFIINTVLIGASFLLIIILIVFFMRAITKPLNKVGSGLANIANGQGDLTIRVSVTGKDEIASLAHHFNDFMQTLNRLIRDIILESNQLKNLGDELATSMEQTATAENEITSILNSMQNQVERQYATVMQSAMVVNEFLTGLSNLHSLIEEQATAVSQSSASIEELLASIRSEQTMSEKTTTVIGELVTASKEGRDNIAVVTREVDEISNQSEMLAEANTLISSIAARTNLLAMNAAIEAAHAGDAGKGFAVVADEIRKLAENASRQSKSIAENLKSIKGVIEKVVMSSKTTEHSFGRMDSLIRDVNQLQTEVMNAVSEQSMGSNEIMTALTRINEITENVRTTSGKMDSRSQDIQNDVDQLKEISNTVLSGMTEITKGIREINTAVHAVQEQSQRNRESIHHVSELTDQFTLAEEETEGSPSESVDSDGDSDKEKL